MSALGLAHHFGHQRIDGGVERVARLVTAGEDTIRQPLAGFVDLGGDVAAAQFKLEQQRVAGVAQRVVKLLGAVGNAVDDAGGLLLEFGGDAVEPVVQHVVDAVRQIDELVMDVAGLEVQARGQAFAGVEHGAGGFAAGFLETVEQVAAAFAEREDHVVAGAAQRAGDVFAALLKRAGDALGDFINARGDGVADQGDVVAQIDLHAGNGAADLFGLADEVVALMRDVLQQRADAHFVVGIGALKCRDFVGDQRFEFAGARDGALHAVAHGGDLAADGLADRHHGIAGGVFGFGESHRHLRHRLRDHAQFLSAPGEACEEIEQQDRCQQHRDQADERQRAAVVSQRLQRGIEAVRQQSGADQPDHGENGGKRIDVAGGAALLDRLQNLADGLAVIVRGAPIEKGFVGWLVLKRPRAEHRLVTGRFGHCNRGNDRWCSRAGAVRGRRFAHIQGFLNCRKRNFGGVLSLLGTVRHASLRPCLHSRKPRNDARRGAFLPSTIRGGPESCLCRPACALLPQTSYWLAGSNEMDVINTILTILNHR